MQAHQGHRLLHCVVLGVQRALCKHPSLSMQVRNCASTCWYSYGHNSFDGGRKAYLLRGARASATSDVLDESPVRFSVCFAMRHTDDMRTLSAKVRELPGATSRYSGASSSSAVLEASPSMFSMCCARRTRTSARTSAAICAWLLPSFQDFPQ